jgi:4'-phosphopantetheinyl transferase
MRCSIDVWFLDLSAAPPLTGCRLAALRDDERLRLGGYLAAAPARRFALARVALRMILGERSGIDPSAILFGDDARGKPRRVDGLGGSFSVSHSGERVAIAVSDTHELGMDIERNTSFANPERLSRLACSAAERAWLAAHPQQAEAQFGRLWVRKEALLKAVGMGLRTRPSTIDLAPQMLVEAGESTLDGPMTGMRSRILWESLDLVDDCQAAVAAIAHHGEAGLDVTRHVFDAARLVK